MQLHGCYVCWALFRVHFGSVFVPSPRLVLGLFVRLFWPDLFPFPPLFFVAFLPVFPIRDIPDAPFFFELYRTQRLFALRQKMLLDRVQHLVLLPEVAQGLLVRSPQVQDSSQEVLMEWVLLR